MITIRTSSGRRFDLLPDINIGIEENSPILSDSGSYSLSIELPPTRDNLVILENPERFDRRKKYVGKIPVIITAGVWEKWAEMHIDSVHPHKSITATLFFAESPFYQKLKDKRLNEMFKDQIRDDYASHGATALNIWRGHLGEVMCGDKTDDFYVFPLLLQKKEHEIREGDGNFEISTRWESFIIANRPAVAPAGGGGSVAWSSTGLYYELEGMEFSYDDSGNKLTNPFGYGWAPFLKLSWVLTKTFEKLGYTLANSILTADDSFKKLCILHNTIDSMVKGTIDYSQLLPDIAVDDFIKSIENSFGCRFVVDERKKTVTPHFFKDIFTVAPVKDYSGMLEDYPDINITSPAFIKLTQERLQPEAEPIEFETYGEMFKKHDGYKGSYKNKFLLAAAIPTGIQPGIYFVRDTRLYYHVAGNGSFTAVEKNTMNLYEQGEEVTHDEHPTGLGSVVLQTVPLRGETPKKVEADISKTLVIIGGMILSLVPKYDSDSGIISQMPYINSVRHLNTVLETKTEKAGKEDEVSYKTESEVSLPLHLAFYVGRQSEEDGNADIIKVFMGSPDGYNNTGEKRADFDTSMFSLYSNFWKEYADVISSSFHVISGRPQLTEKELMQIDFTKPVLVNGQKSLIETVQYEITRKGINIVNMTFRIIKPHD